MATRQYIGARYVIKIYENSQTAGSAEWEANTSYEPLTMVTYQNSSYLSKKAVPATVGNPASNTDYWVVTGAYNGQIATLQSQVNNINNAEIPAINSSIDAIEDELEEVCSDLINKKIYIMGDSISDPNVLANNWAEQLKTKLAPFTTDVTISGINGASITRDAGVQVPSLTQRFNTTSKDMDILILELGVNDWILNHDLADIAGELSSFMSEINALDTPPIVYWIMPFKNKDPRTTLHTFWLDVYRSYYAYFASSNGIRLIDGSNVPILNTMNATNITKYFIDDTYQLHPNELGSKYICDYVFKKLISGGDNAICDFVTTVSLSSYVATGVTLGQSALKFISDGTCNFMLNGYTTPTAQEFKILDAIMPLKYMTNYPTVPVTAYDSNKAPVPAWISMKNDGCLYINVPSTYVNQAVTFFANFSVNNSAVYDNYG